MVTVWVEHKQLGAGPIEVEKSRFEKLMGAKGWTVTDPPENQGRTVAVEDDPGGLEQRRKELAEVEPPTRDDPYEARRKELVEVKLPTRDDPYEARRKELANVAPPEAPADPYEQRRVELAAAQVDLEEQTVDELREMLRDRGEKVSGNKPELIARLNG